MHYLKNAEYLVGCSEAAGSGAMLNLRLIDAESFYTGAELAKLIGKSEAWLERKRWAGEGPAYRRGRPVTYKGADVLAWLDATRVQPEKAA